MILNSLTLYMVQLWHTCFNSIKLFYSAIKFLYCHRLIRLGLIEKKVLNIPKINKTLPKSIRRSSGHDCLL